MSFVAVPGRVPVIDYGGQPMELLANLGEGFALSRMVIPSRFAGPVPHAHDCFDEGIFVLSGRLRILADDEESELAAGSMLVAARGGRHGFANPFDEPATVLTFWTPGELGVRFMTERAAVFTTDGPPDPAAMDRFYREHDSRLLP